MYPVQLTTKNVVLADDVRNLTSEKLKKLDKYIQKYPEDALKAIIMLKKRTHRNEDDLYVVSIAFYIPSRIFHAHQHGYTLEETINDAVMDIEDQLKKHKEKLQNRD